MRHRGTLRVDGPPDGVFPLFTAPGERLWVPGWEPRILYGGDGREPGAVFLTGADGESTIWLVVDFDPSSRYARYARITPGSRAGTVEVRVAPEGTGSLVKVTYELTALGSRGQDAVAAFDGDAFRAMLREWERLIAQRALDYERIEELL